MNYDEKDLYYTGAFNQVININISELADNKDIDSLILSNLKKEIEHKCSKHGFIKKDSTHIIKRSIAKINSTRLDGSLSFDISYSADVCCPIVGQVVKCEVKNKNKMGILAEIKPITIVITKNEDDDNRFEEIEVGSKVNVKIVGSRFDLYDTHITAIGKLN